MEQLLILTTPNQIRGTVRIEANDVEHVIDKKTKSVTLNERQLPIVKELKTTSVQEGPSLRTEYPKVSGVKITTIAEHGGQLIQVATGDPVLLGVLMTDSRVKAMAWKEAQGLLDSWLPGASLVAHGVMPGDVLET